MAVQNQPTGDPRFVQFARYWRPSRSSTTLWLQEQERDPYRPGEFRAKRMLRLLKWGNDIYVPIEEGMHIGIGLYNGADTWRAYPTYIEAANIYDGGPEHPNACTPDHMWELRPYQTMVMDKIVNPSAQRGRPLTIVRSGTGFGIGEATFGTSEFRGQIRVYERSQLYVAPRQSYRGENEGYATRGGGATRGGFTPESYGMPKGGGVLGGDDEPSTLGGSFRGASKGFDPNEGRAAIGAGEEVHQTHTFTGVNYKQDAQPVGFLRIEFRTDLIDMLNQALGYGRWTWDFDVPSTSNWWDLPDEPTASHIPVAPRRPHRP